MDWILENWFWLLVGVLFIWMHTRMHGGHGGHGGHGSHGGHGCCGGGHASHDDEDAAPQREVHQHARH